MELSKSSALTDVARDPRARGYLVAFGLVLLTASIIVAAIVTTLALTNAQAQSLRFIARTLGALGGLLLGLAFLVPAVTDESAGTAMRIAYLAAGILILTGTAILPFLL